MKNLILSSFVFIALLTAGCNKTEKTVETTETTTKSTTDDAATRTGRPAHGETGHNHATDHQAAAVYSCPMHPEVTSATPGDCPKCGMTMEKMSMHNEAAK